MHCQLLMSGVPRAVAASTRLPALRTLLRHAGEAARFAGDWQAWLCHRFGVARQEDWPVAPFAALGDGLDAASGYWLCASPVCLQPQRDNLVMLDGALGDLDIAQAQRLAETLNTHFEADGLRIFAPHPLRWYLRTDAVPRLDTVPLQDIRGRRINDRLPQGADALVWHRHGTEMQMLLHAHPVNEVRERDGLLPVNGVWLWGGGVLPRVPMHHSIDIWSDAVLARGLARSGEVPCMPGPANACDWLAQCGDGRAHLAILEHAHQGDARDDAQAWMQRLEQAWFAPLLHALRRGRIARLDLHLADDDAVASHVLTRADLWKFWRLLARPGNSHG